MYSGVADGMNTSLLVWHPRATRFPLEHPLLPLQKWIDDGGILFKQRHRHGIIHDEPGEDGGSESVTIFKIRFSSYLIVGVATV
jgi:hypothetical protein